MLRELVRNIAFSHQIFIVEPANKGTIEVSIGEIFIQLNKQLVDNKCSNFQVIKQLYFIDSNTLTEYLDIKKTIEQEALKYQPQFVPTTIVAQKPLSGAKLCCEFTIATDIAAQQVEVCTVGAERYLKVTTPLGQFVISNGLQAEPSISNLLDQSEVAFSKMNNILQHEGLDFAHVVRQWNYIQNIVDHTDGNQHYQIFNDVRSIFYSNSKFVHGYPSATGIGMNTGGIIVDFYAFKPHANTSVYPLKSPVQTDAHEYGTEVIEHNNLQLSIKGSTPKFERAKALMANGEGLIFVSGTAAIKGQQSASAFNAGQQTRMTLDNIEKLVAIANLQQQGIDLVQLTAAPVYFRVYIKRVEDYAEVRNAFYDTFDTPVVFVVADICRPELLVEIEAVYNLLH